MCSAILRALGYAGQWQHWWAVCASSGLHWGLILQHSKTRIEDWLWSPVYSKHLHSNQLKQKLKHIFFTRLKVFYLLNENINKDDYFLNNIYSGSFKIETWRNWSLAGSSQRPLPGKQPPLAKRAVCQGASRSYVMTREKNHGRWSFWFITDAKLRHMQG